MESAPTGTYPPLLAFKILTDNMPSKSWLNRVQCSSRKGQQLMQLLSALLYRSDLGFNGEHIAGEDNIQPDRISRLSPSLSFPDRRTQILSLDAALKSWTCFLPSPDLLSLLRSQLYLDAPTEQPTLPNVLGTFKPMSCTTTGSFVI